MDRNSILTRCVKECLEKHKDESQRDKAQHLANLVLVKHLGLTWNEISDTAEICSWIDELDEILDFETAPNLVESLVESLDAMDQYFHSMTLEEMMEIV